jgi:hypothetical protein
MRPFRKPAFHSLLRYLETAPADEGMMESTASSMRSAVKRLGEVLTSDEREDVRLINPEFVAHRFRMRNPDISPSSVRTYQSRLDSALDSFISQNIQYWDEGLESDEGSVAAITIPGGYRKISSSVSYKAEPVEELSYPFPLRPELTIKISNLPRDLKISEVERISAFLRSLAEDYSP